jgi:hypothetical protein
MAHVTEHNVSISTREIRDRMVGRILARMASGAMHVTVRGHDGQRVAGEIDGLDYDTESGEWSVDIIGPDGDSILVSAIATMRTTPRRHCAYCKSGW